MMDLILELTETNLFFNIIYDILKILLSLFFAKVIYDGIFMRFRWGGWKMIVKKGDKILVTRLISAQSAQRILADNTEFSVYAKGVVSPYEWLNEDLGSKKAINIGLLQKNQKDKIITVDLDNNPGKPVKSEKPKPFKVRVDRAKSRRLRKLP